MKEQIFMDLFPKYVASIDIINKLKDNVANGIVDPIIKIIGAVMFIYGSYAVLRYVMGGQQGEGAHWIKWIVAVIFGAMFFLNGLTGWSNVGRSSNDQVQGLFTTVTVLDRQNDF
ncbi:hypothetical protein AALT52_01335 [Ligilactobacillus faecis]|uniref:Uncharacterized protein n=1 Tax=Ligilactobacillus faecis TaxID=762833 RepID=A0ABV4DQ24_9LACO